MVHHPSSCLSSFSVLVLEEQVPGERGVHVAMDVGRSGQQHQPYLVPAGQVQDGRVGGGRPVRNALGPNCRHHFTLLHQVNRSLLRHEMRCVGWRYSIKKTTTTFNYTFVHMSNVHCAAVGFSKPQRICLNVFNPIKNQFSAVQTSDCLTLYTS